jgi:hypothetical protein
VPPFEQPVTGVLARRSCIERCAQRRIGLPQCMSEAISCLSRVNGVKSRFRRAGRHRGELAQAFE